MKRFWKKQLPAALLALVLVVGMMPAATAAAQTKIEASVDAGEKVVFSRTEFKSLFEEEEDYDVFVYMEITDFDGLDSYGHFVAEDDEGDLVTLDEDDLTDRWFYYYPNRITYSGDCALDDLTFVADSNAKSGTLVLDILLVGEDEEVPGTLEIEVDGGSSSSSSKVSLTYTVDEDEEVTFDRDDFDDLFEKVYNDFYYLRFTDSDNLDKCGYLYSKAYDSLKKQYYNVDFDEDDITDGYFYFYDSDVEDDGSSYTLDDLTFAADDDTNGKEVTLDFTLYGEARSDRINGTLTIKIGKGDSTDLTYKVDANDEITFDRDDFQDIFEEKYEDFFYLRFTDSDNLDDCGYLYSMAYDEDDDDYYEVEFDEDDITDGYFYYYDSDVEDDNYSYTLDDLTFAADRYTDGEKVVLEFTLYGEDTRDQVKGTLTIEIGEEEDEDTPAASNYVGNIRYAVAAGANVQINANDISRFFNSFFPNDKLQYVVLNGVPSTGSLFYNYYGASAYGTTTRAQLTVSNCSGQAFYPSPSSTSQFALTELTYVPSGYNYCAAIPFTAYGTSSRSVSGAILISVSRTVVSEVYGVTPKNASVNFPASSIYNAVFSASNMPLTSIQLLNLPAATVGTIYVGGSTAVRATTTAQYTYASGTNSISQLRFVPAGNYTGSVSIPYVALNANGVAIASGVFSLGVVNTRKTFTDVSSSTWCYKYVTELSDASVIDGYADGSFKSDNTISYGAALKLIMLAAGYPEQAPTSSNVFSGYLARAQADGLITRSNVNLSGPITRLQVAQLAAAALKLDTSNLSSVQPFTDTTDPLVRALNAAGIIEGYFNNGTYAYRPNNTLTRGQVSAIVWRMYNYRK